MAYAYKCPHKYYLIWDADTILLNKIAFWDNDRKPLFAMKTEFHIPYFKTIDKLFCKEVTKLTDKSFIAEHMLINKDCMLDMLAKIENNKMLKGEAFYEKIMHAIDKNDIQASGFSEFETYGNYILKYYPHLYGTRTLRTFRDGAKLINKKDINDGVLKWISSEYDTVSFEKHSYHKTSKKFKSIFRFIVRYRIISFSAYRYCYKIFHKIFKRVIK
jgi:hypothetical protein